ncbi:placenta-specific gene 8 protein [Danio rerio]|uniref:Plac8 onzin-related protein 10 n=4 Tax=Danio rerio TaxID=7955 RepID=A0A8M1PUM0_DANRE|nr:placenta-specific gene 8 protein [Danio rerio]XP_021335009.1 placenta-specific gene 8 protein [Danio rerio]|eukprot:XP_001338157.1 placenta-specific gene 8 protein [Danio rerio]
MAAVVVQQVPSKPQETLWNSGICDCFQDLNSCCYAYWCCPCFACSTAGEFGESTCLPLVDILGPAVMASFGVAFCVPPVTMSLRVAIRHKYNIRGSICNDIAVSCCCVMCSWCQMNREIKARKNAPNMILTTQPLVQQSTTTTQVITSQQTVGMPAAPAVQMVPGQPVIAKVVQ